MINLTSNTARLFNLFLLGSILMTVASAQTPHLVGWHSKQPFKQSIASCYQKSVEAMEKAKLDDIVTHDEWMVSGSNKYLRAAIRCTQVKEGVLINIQVAGANGREKEALKLRDKLKAYITTKSFPDGSWVPSYHDRNHYHGPQVWTEKRVYRPVERIVVEFKNLPAERTDEWITIVPFDANPGAFRQWKYTGKLEDGAIEFMGLTRGNYEVRYHSSFGDKEVRARYPFKVD